MPRIRGARVEPWALRPRRRRRSGEEPERLRTQVELKGGRSPTEPVGWSDKAQPEERSPEAMAGQRPTKAEPEGWGSPVELVDQWVTVEARELGAEVEPLGLRAEAESGPRRRRWGILQPRRCWRMADPRGSHHTDGGGWGRARGLPDDSGGGGRSGREDGHFRGAGTGGHFRGAGTGGHFRGAGTGESEAPSGLDGTSRDDGERRGGIRTPAQSPSQSNPPPCPAVTDVESAHPQPRCRGRSSTPRSHRPRLPPLWWALSPALAPDLTCWAQLPRRSSAQSLGFALARSGKWLSVIGGLGLMLRTAGRWWTGLWVRSGSGEIIHGADGEWRSVTRQSPLHEGGEIFLRTIFGQQRSASGVQARIIEWAERVVRVAGGVSYTQEQSSMVLERSVPLLQQEEEEFGPDEGIHGYTQLKQKTINKTEGRRRGNCCRLVLLSRITREARKPGTRNEETRNSQTESLILQTVDRDHRQGKHSRTNKH